MVFIDKFVAQLISEGYTNIKVQKNRKVAVVSFEDKDDSCGSIVLSGASEGFVEKAEVLIFLYTPFARPSYDLREADVLSGCETTVFSLEDLEDGLSVRDYTSTALEVLRNRD